jgi:hypothetical protein
MQEAAGVIGLQIQMLNASTSREIDAAFATLARASARSRSSNPQGYVQQPASL